jgi:hypothetical protein
MVKYGDSKSHHVNIILSQQLNIVFSHFKFITMFYTNKHKTLNFLLKNILKKSKKDVGTLYYYYETYLQITGNIPDDMISINENGKRVVNKEYLKNNATEIQIYKYGIIKDFERIKHKFIDRPKVLIKKVEVDHLKLRKKLLHDCNELYEIREDDCNSTNEQRSSKDIIHLIDFYTSCNIGIDKNDDIICYRGKNKKEICECEEDCCDCYQEEYVRLQYLIDLIKI